MIEMKLDVRLDGFADPIASLSKDENSALSFAYAASYLDNRAAYPLSLSLPLTEGAYEDARTRPFFENLLQERDGTLRQLLDREGLSRDDVAGILYHLGKDCSGALSVLPEGSPPVKVPGDYARDYVTIEPARLNEIVRSLHRRERLPDGTSDPSPLAGVQSKIALTLLPDGNFAEPRPGSGAPTTHILKVPDQAHPDDPKLEAEALSLSRLLRFETTDAAVVNFGGIDALVITRFDRALSDEGKIIRVHQEDFAQALGLPASLKYERNGRPGRRFDAAGIARILDATVDPASEKRTFIANTLFDLMIGNVDGHAKNFGLLYEAGGRLRTTPRYDIMPTRIDPSFTDELAYSIGNAATLDDISIGDFGLFLNALGVTSGAAQRRLRSGLSSQIAEALASQLKRLDQAGMKRFADLIANNTSVLLSAFELKLPAGIAERDAYVERGGGWLIS